MRRIIRTVRGGAMHYYTLNPVVQRVYRVFIFSK